MMQVYDSADSIFQMRDCAIVENALSRGIGLCDWFRLCCRWTCAVSVGLTTCLTIRWAMSSTY